MSERKVLNKYYPPDYDPALIPKLRLAKDRQYVIRVMAPFHMRCKTCGNYIYKGTKFNSRKETVQDEDYIGLRIFRFYIKCTKCVAEITFKTDPENMDYVIEHGATRNFEAEKLLEKQEKEIQRQKEEDEGNPMKLLEMRTRDSKREMERMENLEELRDLNQRKAKVNYEGMLQRYQETEQEKKKRELEEDELEVKAIFGTNKIRRLDDKYDSDEEADAFKIHPKRANCSKASDLLLTEGSAVDKKNPCAPPPISNKNLLKKKAAMLGIVKKNTAVDRKQSKASSDTQAECSVSSNNSNSLHQSQADSKQPGAACSQSSGEVLASTTAQNTKCENTKLSGAAGSLGLLGGYASSSSSEEEE